ncbi:MAG: hypothetical protein AAF802_09525 [Planctomycetota bacterium]
MSRRQASLLNLLLSLLFAIIIIAVAKLNTSGDSFTITGLLIAVWFVPFCILSQWGGHNSVAAELRCLRNKLIGRR